MTVALSAQACACGAKDCRICRVRAIGLARRRHTFTPAVSAQLRRAYASAPGELSSALDRLQRDSGIPRAAIKREARRLGLAAQRKRWTGREDEVLREMVGRRSAAAIARQVGRTPRAVEKRAEHLGLSRRPNEGYTPRVLAEAMGVSVPTVDRWIERGWLGNVMHRGGGVRLKDANVVEFLHAHKAEYDLRRVDQSWFKSLALGGGK